MRTVKICFGNNCFIAEEATTIFEKARGLSGRKSLDADKGMLFSFGFSGIYPFTMKNTLIPLDIIWMDKNYKVVDIKENCAPCRGFFCPPIIPSRFAKYVLEINAGFCERLEIKIGEEAKSDLT